MVGVTNVLQNLEDINPIKNFDFPKICNTFVTLHMVLYKMFTFLSLCGRGSAAKSNPYHGNFVFGNPVSQIILCFEGGRSECIKFTEKKKSF